MIWVIHARYKEVAWLDAHALEESATRVWEKKKIFPWFH